MAAVVVCEWEVLCEWESDKARDYLERSVAAGFCLRPSTDSGARSVAVD